MISAVAYVIDPEIFARTAGSIDWTAADDCCLVCVSGDIIECSASLGDKWAPLVHVWWQDWRGARS